MNPLLLLVLQGPTLALALSSTPVKTLSSPRHETVIFDNKAALDSAWPITRDLLGLSIEFSFIIDYLGDKEKPNPLSSRLLQNIENITGSSPQIRIGGSTQDVAKYCPDCPQTMNNTFEDSDIHAVNVSFNSNLFTVLNENVPVSQKYIFGLNLGQDDVAIPLAELAAAQEYLNLSRLTHYELGNEPDYYPTRVKSRPPSYDVVAYVQQSVAFLKELVASVGEQAQAKPLQFLYGSLANYPRGQDFTISTLAQFGINDIVPQVTAYSGHEYFGEACTEEGKALITIPLYLNHLNTLSRVASFKPNIEAAHSAGAPYLMGETNSAACHGLAGVSDTFAAALWMVDYVLTSATFGIQGLFFHNGVDYAYNVWQPTEGNGTVPHVQPLYYGFLLYADLIKDFKDGARVASIPSLDGVGVVHFAVYAAGQIKPQKLVILNLDLVDDSTPRQQRTFDVSFIFGQQVQVTRLTGPSSNATDGISWAGQTVDKEGNLSGKRVVERLGNSTVSVGSSEAVIVESNPNTGKER